MSGFEGKSRMAAAQFRWWGKTAQRKGGWGRQTTPVPAWRSGDCEIVCAVSVVGGRPIEETRKEYSAGMRSARRNIVFL